ncbi:MAG: hypothetical protein HY796_13125 [Elusimicrobia bacterium]|nr:hypothetical protein [Elusimicrobiota bacterium]
MYHVKIDGREAVFERFSGSAKSEIKEELAKTGLMRTTTNGSKEIKMSIFIIAEIGINHNGDGRVENSE